jgi:hypothetical protein
MTLFKVRLTDPIVKNRTKPQNVYLVMAADQAAAVEVLRSESPSAFTYDPEVEVECYPHASMRVITTRVPVKKTPRVAP